MYVLSAIKKDMYGTIIKKMINLVFLVTLH